MEGIERVGKLEAVAPLQLDSAGGVPVLTDNRPRKRLVRLIGNSNPYSFVDAYRTPGGGQADLSDIPVTGMCYEYNGATGLDGKLVEVGWTSAGDYRFQAKRRGGCKTGKLCMAMHDLCAGGATTPGNYQISFNGGAPIMFPTTPQPPKECYGPLKTGSYQITPVSPPGTTYVFTPSSATVDVTDPCVEYDLSFERGPATSGLFFFLSVLCCGAQFAREITVDIEPGGIHLSGPIVFDQIHVPGPGTYTITITGRRFVTATTTVTLEASCNPPIPSVTVNLDAAPGFICYPLSPLCNDPISLNWLLTDSLTGVSQEVTLNTTPPNIGWTFTANGALPVTGAGPLHLPPCPGVTVPITYHVEGQAALNVTLFIPADPTTLCPNAAGTPGLAGFTAELGVASCIPGVFGASYGYPFPSMNRDPVATGFIVFSEVLT